MITAVAVALANKTVERLSDAGQAALAALVRFVRRKLGESRSSELVLESAEVRPSDEARLLVLQSALEQAAAEDRHFAEELGRLWRWR